MNLTFMWIIWCESNKDLLQGIFWWESPNVGYSPLQRFRESTISPVTYVKEDTNDKIIIYNCTDDVQIRAESKGKDKLAFNNLKNM